MASTFNGLEVAKRALHTQQAALYTTGHNISNANTEGYTRQRVNMQASSPYPPASRNRPEIPGQVGSGVEVGSVERIRDSFIDKQYRQENTKVGYYTSKAEMMSQMEDILNEPSDEGLAKTMDQFWESLEDLSVNPEDSGARSVVLERGKSVAETFQYLNSSLEGVRDNLRNEISVDNTEVNSLIDQISQLNGQIEKIEPHGYVPNDLYDKRDKLIDELSEYADIEVSYEPAGGNPSPLAQGNVTIKITEGLSSEVKLIDGATGDVNHFTVSTDNTTGDVDQISIGTNNFDPEDYNVNGKLKALIEGVGYTDGGNAVGEYKQMLTDLDTLAENFINEFNAVHQTGYSYNGDQNINFFSGSSASTIEVAIDDEFDIAAGNTDAQGDGENAVDLSNVYTEAGVINGDSSIKGYYESVIGKMGVNAEEANRMQSNSEVLKQQVQENRQSISSVSLDEEMTNLIQYQHAYNAAARNMTAVDEMLDRIINNMGLVGR
ncbi:flagellar hook-associated protein FlgK [Gracilibacillus kekensis]|uniref:Flagellar hook-associated protein 1 n=1 Tax=Gracilibacillus kekensis TaxID=1027249 RepID=A0A1M7N1I3_9BACI|nr:flagellar hook-associated protein FlgK [Gracilibacillus kekensis]SHM96781.1 flagellar hook-associated protein 1 FlgK [Gracilibacillus kekensis]